MATLEGLRRQIGTATDLSSVVTTMKTLAAVSVHQYEEAVDALTDYNLTIEMGFQIALRGEPFQADFDQTSGRTAAIVFGSDQGMCGQFNEEIVARATSDSPAPHAEQPWTWLVIGRRAEGQLLDAGFGADRTYDVPTSVSDITNLVQQTLPHIERLREESDIARWIIFHNRRTSASTFAPRRRSHSARRAIPTRSTT